MSRSLQLDLPKKGQLVSRGCRLVLAVEVPCPVELAQRASTSYFQHFQQVQHQHLPRATHFPTQRPSQPTTPATTVAGRRPFSVAEPSSSLCNSAHPRWVHPCICGRPSALAKSARQACAPQSSRLACARKWLCTVYLAHSITIARNPRIPGLAFPESRLQGFGPSPGLAHSQLQVPVPDRARQQISHLATRCRSDLCIQACCDIARAQPPTPTSISTRAIDIECDFESDIGIDTDIAVVNPRRHPMRRRY